MNYKLVASYEIAEYTIRFTGRPNELWLYQQETEIKLILKRKGE